MELLIALIEYLTVLLQYIDQFFANVVLNLHHGLCVTGNLLHSGFSPQPFIFMIGSMCTIEICDIL